MLSDGSRRLLADELFVGRLGDVARHVGRLPSALATLQRHLPVCPESGSREPPFRGPIDVLVSTGWAAELLTVAVSENELKRFRGSILFDPTTSHGIHSRTRGPEMYRLHGPLARPLPLTVRLGGLTLPMYSLIRSGHDPRRRAR